MVGMPGRSGGDRTRHEDQFPMDGAPERPPNQSAAFYEKWDEIISQLHLPSLRKVDVHQLTNLVDVMVYKDELKRLAATTQDPVFYRLINTYVNTIIKLSIHFGLSPGDRQKLKVTDTIKEDDPMKEWLTS